MFRLLFRLLNHHFELHVFIYIWDSSFLVRLMCNWRFVDRGFVKGIFPSDLLDNSKGDVCLTLIGETNPQTETDKPSVRETVVNPHICPSLPVVSYVCGEFADGRSTQVMYVISSMGGCRREWWKEGSSFRGGRWWSLIECSTTGRLRVQESCETQRKVPFNDINNVMNV